MGAAIGAARGASIPSPLSPTSASTRARPNDDWVIDESPTSMASRTSGNQAPQLLGPVHDQAQLGWVFLAAQADDREVLPVRGDVVVLVTVRAQPRGEFEFRRSQSIPCRAVFGAREL